MLKSSRLLFKNKETGKTQFSCGSPNRCWSHKLFQINRNGEKCPFLLKFLLHFPQQLLFTKRYEVISVFSWRWWGQNEPPRVPIDLRKRTESRYGSEGHVLLSSAKFSHCRGRSFTAGFVLNCRDKCLNQMYFRLNYSRFADLMFASSPWQQKETPNLVRVDFFFCRENVFFFFSFGEKRRLDDGEPLCSDCKRVSCPPLYFSPRSSSFLCPEVRFWWQSCKKKATRSEE